MTILPYLIVGAIIIAMIAGWLGYSAGRRKAERWREQSNSLMQLCKERDDRFQEAMELLDQAHRNTARTRKVLTKHLPPGIREKMQALNEEFEARWEAIDKSKPDLEAINKLQVIEADEFPSELDL